MFGESDDESEDDEWKEVDEDSGEEVSKGSLTPKNIITLLRNRRCYGERLLCNSYQFWK